MMRVSRQGDAIRVAFLDGQARWLSARLAYFPPDMSLSVGPMCCSPTRSGFKARFDSFVIGPAISRDLHG
jgi:regulation of enolase protein 1 (concanavalin A-like superfamily)